MPNPPVRIAGIPDAFLQQQIFAANRVLLLAHAGIATATSPLTNYISINTEKC